MTRVKSDARIASEELIAFAAIHVPRTFEHGRYTFEIEVTIQPFKTQISKFDLSTISVPHVRVNVNKKGVGEEVAFKAA